MYNNTSNHFFSENIKRVAAKFVYFVGDTVTAEPPNLQTFFGGGGVGGNTTLPSFPILN